MDKKSVEKFMALFRGRTDDYGFKNPKTGSAWYEGKRDAMGEIMYDEHKKRVLPTGLTLADYENHLAFKGGLALCIIPNTRTDNVHFACLDIDKDDIDHLELVRRIAAFGLPLHVFISSSGAAHVYMFFDGEGKPARVVRAMMHEYALALGCGRDLPKHELFPNQDEFDELNHGHHITLPLYNCDDPDDRRGKFVSSTGQTMGLEGFLERVEVWPSKRKMPFPVRGETFEMGPPCLESIQKQGGFPAGTRNPGLYNVGVYLKKAYPDDWEERLEAFNRLYLSEPLDKKEIVNIIRSLKKKDYKYTCLKEPIASYCEKTVCEKRQFGIRSNEQAAVEEAKRIALPITKLRKHETDPIIWEILIGEEPNGVWVTVSTTQLRNYGMLQNALLEALNTVPPTMKQKHWHIKLDDLMKNHMEIKEVSGDSGEKSFARDAIRELVENASRKQADARTDVWGKWDPEKMGSLAHVTTGTVRSHLETKNIRWGVPQVALFMKQEGWQSINLRMSPTSQLRIWRIWVPGLCPRLQDETKEGEVIEFEDVVNEV